MISSTKWGARAEIRNAAPQVVVLIRPREHLDLVRAEHKLAVATKVLAILENAAPLRVRARSVRSHPSELVWKVPSHAFKKSLHNPSARVPRAPPCAPRCWLSNPMRRAHRTNAGAFPSSPATEPGPRLAALPVGAAVFVAALVRGGSSAGRERLSSDRADHSGKHSGNASRRRF
jgi:hypothetical protein